MNVLVTGAKGQLGFDVVKELKSRGHGVIGIDIEDLDITKEKEVLTFLTELRPDVLIHCAAYTAVDAAEEHKELCYLINEKGTKYIAKACALLDIKLMYISTDYVFDGVGLRPFAPDDVCVPINVYGHSKYLGEQQVEKHVSRFFILRISWVFGGNGNNFVKTMLRLAKEKSELNVVADQWGSPTYTKDVSRLIGDMILTEKYGYYHATNEGFCSWSDFAKQVFEEAGLKVKVNPVASTSYPTKALRPSNSRLSKEKLGVQGFSPLPPWQQALKNYLREEKGSF